MATGPTLPPQAYTREILTSAFNWLQSQPESVKKLATTPDALVGLFMRAQRYGASSMEADAPVSSQAFMSDLKNLAEGLKQFDDPKSELRNEMREARRSSHTATASQNHVSATQSQLAQAQQLAQQLAQAAAMAQQAQVQAQAQTQAHATSQSQIHTQSQAQVNPSGSNSAGQFFSTNHQAHQAAAFLSMNANYPQPQPPQAPQPPTPPAPAYAAPVHVPSSPSTLSVFDTSSASDRSLQMIQEVKTGLNLSSDAEAINMMVSIAYKHLKNLLV